MTARPRVLVVAATPHQVREYCRQARLDPADVTHVTDRYRILGLDPKKLRVVQITPTAMLDADMVRALAEIMERKIPVEKVRL